jgi:hypothetical protein
VKGQALSQSFTTKKFYGAGPSSYLNGWDKPAVNVIKLFYIFIDEEDIAGTLVPDKSFQPGLIFMSKTRAPIG